MPSLRAFQVCGFVALAVGLIVSIISSRAPKRGWVGIVLLLVSALAWTLIETGESSTNLSMIAAFMLISPVAIVYSFRSRRLAPDRAVAKAAFAGSFLVLAFLLYMIAGIIVTFFAV